LANIEKMKCGNYIIFIFFIALKIRFHFWIMSNDTYGAYIHHIKNLVSYYLQLFFNVFVSIYPFQKWLVRKKVKKRM